MAIEFLDTPLAVRPAELEARFAPVFERIAAEGRQRDAGRLPTEVGWLRDAGVTALRVPTALGGSGAGLGQLIDLLIDLAAADPELLPALRWHLRFVEDRLAEGEDPLARHWLRRVGAGLVIGRARSGALGLVTGAAILRGDGAGRLRLNGTHPAGAGGLSAGAVAVTAVDESGQRVLVVVPVDREGVERLDARAGSCPRAGGALVAFTDVIVEPDEILPAAAGGRRTGRAGFAQLVQLAGLAGIARRAVDDAADALGPAAAPDDPRMAAVVGRADAAAFAARAAVRAATASVEVAPDADAAEMAVSRAQVSVVDLVLRATTDLLALGGTDRHWRHARTLALPDPVGARQRAVGAYLLNGRARRDGPRPLEPPFPEVSTFTASTAEAATQA